MATTPTTVTPIARKRSEAVAGKPGRMLDLHCHLLPGFAGGPPDMEAALQLALGAQTHGVEVIVATPRFADGDYREQITLAAAQAHQLTQKLRDRGALIDIQVAGECGIGERLARAIVMDQVPIIGRFDAMRVVMVRLPEARIPKNLVSIIEWMAAQRVRPMLSCPERHRDVLANIDVLAPIVAAGALLEVNAGALAGRHGPYAQRRARELVERGWAWVITSNAHAGDEAGALLEVGREAAAAIIGEQAAWDMVWTRPARIAAPHLLGPGA